MVVRGNRRRVKERKVHGTDEKILTDVLQETGRMREQKRVR